MSSLLNALWHAVTGDGTSEEHASESTHAATPSRQSLPPNPFAPPESSPPPADELIDLTDPIFEGHLLSRRTAPPLQDRPKHAERRKSDATKAPNPANGYQGPPANMKKPGAGMGVQPINTLNRGTGASSTNGRKQTTTYSKHDRKARSIGVQRHSGQEAWLERNSNHRVAISPTRDASHARPPKRRKTENPNAPRMDPVEIVDDEDEAAARSRQTLTPRPPSQFSSHSPYSTNSRHSDISSKRATQPVSEFMNTSGLMAPKRSKPRRKGANGHDVSCGGSPAEASFLGAGSQPHEQSIEIYQEDMDPRDSPRTSTLQSLKQGGDRVPVSRDLGQANGRVTSSYFKSKNPKMAINESIKTETAARDYDMRAEKLARSSGPGRNLRDFQPAEYASEVQDDLIEGSEDELSRPSAPESKDQKSPTEHAQVRKTAPKRLPTFGKSYVLSYARSYNIGPDCVNLTLGHTENPKEFRIGGQDSGGKVNVFEILDLGSVTKVQSDNLRSMRLTGGIIKGNKYWCDLTFAKTRDFKEFRSQYVDPEVLSQSVATQDGMEKVFKLPLKRNDKIGTTPMVNEESCSSGAPNGQGRTSRNRPITGVVNDYKRSDSSTPRMPAATRFLTRSVRSTRAAAPAHGHQVHEEEEPERYSVVHGLGKPWAKPLDYSVDGGFLKRRKATIEWNDLEKLDEGQMLNDSIMTFYMLYLYNELKVSVDRVYFFNTHFFPTLTKKIKGQDGINYDGVKSWTKRDDVFSYDYIVVPINENLHWYLAIICNVDKIKRIQADEEVQEDSQDLDRGSTSLHTSDTPANPKNVADVAGPSSIVAETPAPDDAVVTKDDEGDDVNLFEESKELNLIDRNAEAFDELKQPVDERDEPGEQTLDHESGMAAASSTAAERTSLTLAPGKAMPASKKRTNHKPPSRDPDKPIIMILDSLGLAHSPATRALRQWLEAEGLDKRSMRVEIDNRGHYPKSTQIPMQDNYCDCGLYVLGYLRKFFINPDELSKKLLLSQMSAESDWPDMNPSKMRDDIRNLIFELNDARDGARKEAHKAKKTGSGKEFSAFPTKNDSKEVSPTLRLPDATKAPPASATPTPPAAIKSASTPTAGPPADPPRMGSPFKPESRPGNAVSLTTQAADRDDSAHRLSTIQDFPSVSAETPIQPRRSLAKRVKSPEVRVPVSSPHIDRLHEPYDGASDRSKQPTRQLADLESPLQNRDVRNKGNGNLRMSPAKEAQASSPSRPSRELLATSSPLQARRRSGSHDDPILVDDSQDLDVAVRKQTQSKRKPPRPAKEAPHEIIELDQSQESVKVQIRRLEPRMQNPPIHQRQAHQQVFNRDDSILEVDGLEWAEGRDISHALELSLQDPDEQIGRQANSWPKDLGSPMEDVFDAQAAYLQSPYTVQEVPETQETDPMEVDNDDRVVPESPAQRRSSPHSDVMLVN